MHAAIVELSCAVLLAALPAFGAAADYVDVKGGAFASVIANDASGGVSKVADFSIRVTPVTRGEFLAFVNAHPQWQRGKVSAVFADGAYLSDGSAANTLSPQDAARPVTHVSWFAAEAFCETENARLPTWNEWELVAAADSTRIDARADAQWRSRILSWYARPANEAPPPVGGPANAYGVRDVHGVVWEWVDDFNALLVDSDSRAGSDPDKLKFCGAGAINLQQRESYAILMRVALLSSLKATDSTGSLGFRCARPHTKESR
ncbi:MAG TPA: formylglycine-generating enzyme family protein [Albitalea sp.]|uniref:formylglycine-generating enzyme family protein n=1 Tax=Piscinibacter sp. TaxID=1903157 RepID=UPI002ED2E6C5